MGDQYRLARQSYALSLQLKNLKPVGQQLHQITQGRQL